ncbi:NAD-dependent epimerase/dehydratase family protein [Streptomyces kanamyceticus]|uniref:NAD-dependent epimerase/dehydratase family protein n=1 Tax=Streptomyces kanamyceticus TaxID=1967 RepID=A0A5J6GLG0_STRKN|nr:NAD-dependent epimerase/dehydratase family protein [Streptomyces kanamyceticus]QEU94805.1 NAD-dependent epimerase/dehydratase family protein [Streptomyces kanamyceticus]
MRLLMLGGTEFVGRAVTEAALARGWEVTVFHRGHHAAPEGTRALHGDRLADGGLASLADGEWDVVVDTWSAAPRVVRESARLLAGRVGRYVYVSSGSVYSYPGEAGSDENFRLVDGDPDAEAVSYEVDKRGGELAALAEFGAERTLLARAGLILGPYENIGRLPWWLNRVARGGPVLAPGPRDMGIQFIDVRDLAEWIVDAAAAGLHGPYNLVSPVAHTTMGELLDACVAVAGAADAELRWTSSEVIAAAGIEPWMELPVWVPPVGELYDTLHITSSEKAVAAGLRARPVAETVADTWGWLRSLGGVAPQRGDRPVVGLDPDKEAKALGL